MNVRERIDYLTEENRQLREAMLGKRAGFPFEWGLTIGEERVLNSLFTAPNHKRTVQALLFASGVKDEANPKMIQVRICNLRKKLNPYNIAIKTNWGEGYELSSKSVEIIRDALG